MLMKKFLFMMVAGALAMSSCGSANAEGNEDTAANAAAKEDQSKVLVAYFSATGTTKKAAEQLAEVANADLFEIVPEQLYSEADLDWHNDKSRSSVEMKDLSSRPAIKNGGKVDNIDQYEVVYIGFPIWWYTAPTIVNTFIEANNLEGKVIKPFATSGGSTIEKSTEDLKKTYPKLNIKEGKLLNNIERAELQNWTQQN